MFASLGNLASLLRNVPEMLRQAQEMQGRVQEMQEQLGRLRVEGAAGGGMVRVEANGQQKLLSVSIEPSLLESGDTEMLEDLILAAANQALERAKEAAAEEMKALAAGIDMGGMNDVLAKFGLGKPASE